MLCCLTQYICLPVLYVSSMFQMVNIVTCVGLLLIFVLLVKYDLLYILLQSFKLRLYGSIILILYAYYLQLYSLFCMRNIIYSF